MMYVRTLLFALFLATGLSASRQEEDPLKPDLAVKYAELYRSRLGHLDKLRAYARAGKFPRNIVYQYSGMMEGEGTEPKKRKQPYFIDKAGTPCAVAHLMIQSGEGKLARKVAKADNHVYIRNVTPYSDLLRPVHDWILKSGLTKEECALIQPGYWHRQKDDVAVTKKEQAELREHFKKVESKLMKEMHASLRTSLKRLADATSLIPGHFYADVQVVDPSGTERIGNTIPVPVDLCITAFSKKGKVLEKQVLRQVNPKQQVTLPRTKKDGDWILVQWQCKWNTLSDNMSFAEYAKFGKTAHTMELVRTTKP